MLFELLVCVFLCVGVLCVLGEYMGVGGGRCTCSDGGFQSGLVLNQVVVLVAVYEDY